MRQALQEAMACHQQGRWREAESAYQRILASGNRNPDALHFFGLLRHHQGQSAAAIDIIRRSLRIAPANHHAWINLGNILLTLDRQAEAEDAYRRAIEVDARNADAWYNLGVAQRRRRDLPAAVESLDRSLVLRPGHARSLHQRGATRRDLGRLDDAEADFRAVLTIEPQLVYESLGVLLYRMGRFREAAEIYKQWSEAEPANPVARHMAATGGEGVPDRADDRYIAEVFDRFADSFERNLDALGYQAPVLVHKVIQARYAGVQGSLDVLDAGCGTGLCGPLLRPLARTLHGVDLSAGMLDRAREKAVYDSLVEAELVNFMRARDAAFDLIVAADTLVYFGALQDAIGAAAGAMRPDGLLVFTLELTEEHSITDGYRLEPHGRYSHRPDYVNAVLSQAGFAGVVIDPAILRQERGGPVRGLVVSGIRSS